MPEALYVLLTLGQTATAIPGAPHLPCEFSCLQKLLRSFVSLEYSCSGLCSWLPYVFTSIDDPRLDEIVRP